ncbi:GPP34 family phosphoprotein [Roseomonas sp. CCTCC AB2023176]|uniref:GOLPH3/VPS74 family protein n=1 Tax=Roseomonas sp. CCTCC AB2023176 TaxID=3342640 RepID=UPI0035DDB645
MPLTMPEEILLLTLDDEGRPVGVPAPALDLAVAGAVLMELALHGRVDSDPDRLYLASRTPTGDPLLDDVLARIASDRDRDSRWWMERLSKDAAAFRSAFLDRLVVRGVLRRVQGRVLWFLNERRYPVLDGTQMQEVRARLRAVLLSGEIPDPRDALTIGLCQATGLVTLILSDDERTAATARIAAVASLEEMGRSLSAATRDLYAAMTAYGASP